MLTLLPFNTFQKSAASFFDDTLFQQLQEVDSILDVIHKTEKDVSSWDYSSGVLMWNEYVPQLCMYGFALCEEVQNKKDLSLSVMAKVFEKNLSWHFQNATCGIYTLILPAWMGDEKLHESHQAELIRRDDKYDAIFKVSSTLPLVWPVVKI